MRRSATILAVLAPVLAEIERAWRVEIHDLTDQFAALVHQLGEPIMATIEEIQTDLTALGTAIAADGPILPPGFVAVAQSDLDAIDTSVHGLIAQLAASAAAPVTTPPVTTPPVTTPPVTTPPVTTPPVTTPPVTTPPVTTPPVTTPPVTTPPVTTPPVGVTVPPVTVPITAASGETPAPQTVSALKSLLGV